MKKSILLPALLIPCIIAGVYFYNFLGGLLAGSCFVILIFVTIGKALYKRAANRHDASHETLMKTWKNFLNE